MVGKIKELYLSQLHKITEDTDQHSLASFTDDTEESYGTIIAVVTEPIGGIVDTSDEFYPELGMPQELLDTFRGIRSDIDSEDTTHCHNAAAKQMNLDTRYRKYLQTDEKAKERVSELATRVESGETISVVCFEKQPKYCHRHTLQEVIRDEVNRTEE